MISFSEVNHFSTHSVNVGAPNVSMKVTDRLGRDLFTAQVGDPLLLLFQITDQNSKKINLYIYMWNFHLPFFLRIFSLFLAFFFCVYDMIFKVMYDLFLCFGMYCVTFGYFKSVCLLHKYDCCQTGIYWTKFMRLHIN